MNVFRHLEAAAVTDVGLRRPNNEDAYALCPDFGVYVVADGMGGGADGEFASRAVVVAVSDALNALPLDPPSCQETKLAHLKAAGNRACKSIQRRIKEIDADQMGSTMALVSFDAAEPDQACALHVGDSRVYRFRHGRLHLITKDHSAASAFGAKSDKDVPAMWRGLLTRAVGLKRNVEYEETRFDVIEGDLVLLCSDGLTRMVSDHELRGLLNDAEHWDAKNTAGELVKAAIRAGGKDNVTAIVIKVGPVPAPVSVGALELNDAEDPVTETPTDTPSSDTSPRSTDQLTPTGETHAITPATDDRYGIHSAAGRTPPKGAWLRQRWSDRIQDAWVYMTHCAPFKRKALGAVCLAVVLIVLALLVRPSKDEHILDKEVIAASSDVPQMSATPEPINDIVPPPRNVELRVALSAIDEDPTPSMAWIKPSTAHEWHPVNTGSASLSPGTYAIRFERAGYQSQEVSITLDQEDSEIAPDGWQPGLHLAALMRAEMAQNVNSVDIGTLRREVETLSDKTWDSEYHASRFKVLESKLNELEASSPGSLRVMAPAKWPRDVPPPTMRLDPSSPETADMEVKPGSMHMLQLAPGTYRLYLKLVGYEDREAVLSVSAGGQTEWTAPAYAEWVKRPWLTALEEAEKALKAGRTAEAGVALAHLNREKVPDEPVLLTRADKARKAYTSLQNKQLMLFVADAEKTGAWGAVAEALSPREKGNLSEEQKKWIDLWSQLNGSDSEVDVKRIHDRLVDGERALMIDTSLDESMATSDLPPDADRLCRQFRQRSLRIVQTLNDWKRMAEGAQLLITGSSRNAHAQYIWILGLLQEKGLHSFDPSLLNTVDQQRSESAAWEGTVVALLQQIHAAGGPIWAEPISDAHREALRKLADFWWAHHQLIWAKDWPYVGQRVQQIAGYGAFFRDRLAALTSERFIRIHAAREEYKAAHPEDIGSFDAIKWTEKGGLERHRKFIQTFEPGPVMSDRLSERDGKEFSLRRSCLDIPFSIKADAQRQTLTLSLLEHTGLECVNDRRGGRHGL